MAISLENALSTVALWNATDRAMMADMLLDHGREDEADIMRNGHPVIRNGVVLGASLAICGPMERSYLDTLLFSESDDEGSSLDATYGRRNIHPSAIKQAIEDCQSFLESLSPKAKRAVNGNLERSGHDLVLTRNHHGAGFWDGDWDDSIQEELTRSAHALGEVYTYVVDGMVYTN